MISKKWRPLILAVIILIIGLAAIQIFIAKPESNEFSREKIRLAEVENELTQAIEIGDTVGSPFLVQIKSRQFFSF